jgi:hypothetical protein
MFSALERHRPKLVLADSLQSSVAMYRKVCLSCFVIVLYAASAAAQSPISVTAPSGGANPVASANDFATQTFQDPWDMSQRSDPGWWINGVDYPYSGFSSVSFNGGVFTGTISSDPNIWMLETNAPNLPPIGKNGAAFPINANVYRIFAIRMRVPSDAYMLFYWSTKTMYDAPGLNISSAVNTTAGWRIYFVDLAALGLLSGSEPWNGSKGSLRLDPAPDDAAAGSQVDIDWVRLVDNQPALFRTITWTGTGPVNIYLDNDQNSSNGNLGLVAQNVSGTSYSLNAGALAPGNYYVAIQRTSGGSIAYSSGFYQVNDPATLTITAPSDEGSADDFATTQLNNPWDMTSAADVDQTINVSGGGITTIPNVETEAGAALGDITAFFGTSTLGDFSNPAPCAQFAKPVVYPLFRLGRGAAHHIDPTRYRILTAELGIPNKPRDLCGGSIVRVVWQVAGDAQESYSYGITLNSRAGANVLSRINFDMASIPIDPGSPSQTGWVNGSAAFPGIMSFRIDPHEFANPTSFYIKRIKLAAFETANTSYTVRWTASKTGGTVRVYYDTDRSAASKTLIGSTSASSLNGSLNWNTSGLPQDAYYYVYVEFDDGTNVNGAYSKWPIRIDHSGASTARLVLNRSVLNFGITGGTIMTPQQVVRLTTVNAPAGQPCWTASSDLSFVLVSPTSGCGAASITIRLQNQTYGGNADYSGYVRITSSGAVNSPQLVQTVVRIRTSTAAPGGVIDTPANGSIVSGSVAVTGWAMDDIGIARVTVCRAPVSGEQGGHPLCGANQIYLGDAVMIDDARPDVEAVAPTSPMNYRGGWGFMVLTNMLPNQGNGGFTLYANAIDLEGHLAGLGARTITAQNASATEPFGAIDTPGQGETISGTAYANFGWVLSRVRRADPPGGGSVTVFVDGVAVGVPTGWNKRADLSATFPGYPGINTALGVYGLNTTSYANGVHSIMWLVTDNGGVTSGIGSRFFTVFNTGAPLTEAAMRPAGPDIGRRIADVGGTNATSPVLMRTGFKLTTPLAVVTKDLVGQRRVRANERDRVEIRLGAGSPSPGEEYAGYLVVDGQLRALPVGSSFDPERGVFYWQPLLAYVGDYDFMFVRTRADGRRERIPVAVTLRAQSDFRLAHLAMTRDPWGGITFD